MAYTLDHIVAAIAAAGLTQEQRTKFVSALVKAKPPKQRGRREEVDGARLFEVALLVVRGANEHAAARQAAADLKEPSRTTVSRRLYKKFRKDRDFWTEAAVDALASEARAAVDALRGA